MPILIMTLIAFSIGLVWAIVEIRSGQEFPGHGDVEAAALSAMIFFVADVVISVLGSPPSMRAPV